MSVQDIKNYIEQNKGAYPTETLVAELRKAGHNEVDIKLALGESVPTPINGSDYSTGKKIGHFTIGLLSTELLSTGVGYILVPVHIFFALRLLVLSLSVLTYFKIRHQYPYIAKGMFWSYVIMAIICGLVFLLLYSFAINQH